MSESKHTPAGCAECERLRSANADMLAALRAALPRLKTELAIRQAVLPRLKMALVIRRQLVGENKGGFARDVRAVEAAIARATTP